MSLTEFEQFEATQLIKEKEYKRGFEAGYKAKEKELLEEAEKDQALLGQYEAERQEGELAEQLKK